MGQRKFSELPRIAELDKTDIFALEREDGTKQISFKQLCNAIAVQEIAELVENLPEIKEDDTLSVIVGKINKWHKDALKKIEGLSENILDSKEEIEANTESGKIMGAQAAKEMFNEINSNLATQNLLGAHYLVGENDTIKSYIDDIDNIAYPLIFTRYTTGTEYDTYWCFILTIRYTVYSVQIYFGVGKNVIKIRNRDNGKMGDWMNIIA